MAGINIHHSTPWSSTRDFGGAINRFCRMVPDDDWVCIRDGDTTFLLDNWGKHLEDVIRKYGERFNLFGCMTNRVGVEDQLVSGLFSNEFNTLKLTKEARKLDKTKYAKVKEVEITSGLLMLFPKRLWLTVGGFDKNTKHFDKKFCEKVKRSGHRIGIIEGLYLYHHYRVQYPNREMAIRHSKHLGGK